MRREAADLDPYLVLGVARTATAAQIRDAYRALGARYHPDLHQGNPLEGLAAAKMTEINLAYDVLSHPERRAAYDRSGSLGTAPPHGAAPGFAQPRRGARLTAGLALLLLTLPLVVRFGGALFRGLTAGIRAVIESLASLQGTPAALAMLVALAVAVGVGVVRNRRRRRR